MAGQLERPDNAAELAAQWQATVEAHIAGQPGECVHLLAEAELKEENAYGHRTEAWPSTLPMR
jgi:hypothetical protein